MRHRDLAGFGLVLELVMRSNRVHQVPAVGFQSFDEVCAVHVCNYKQYTQIHNSFIEKSMTQPNRPALKRAPGYLCTQATSHQVSTLKNQNSVDIALHLHGGEVAPNEDGGYSIETLALATVVMNTALAREIIASLSAAVDRADGHRTAEPEAAAGPVPQPEAAASGAAAGRVGKTRGPLGKTAG